MSLPTILTPTYTGPAPRMKSKGPISLSPALPAAQTAPFEDDKQWKLFVTTNTKVSVWDSQGYNAVFTSDSEGIVAAKRAKDGSVLAIADSQVVMLHRIEEGQDKSYRLKGTQRCRHLQYDHDSRSLFFTDSIHNSVQSYSLKENRVVEAAKSHPSPITTFAISSDSNLVISCSADPPIIQIHNRLMASTISITPRSSSAPVVHCSFHPSRLHVFVLAFGDGVLAAYDYSKISGGNKAKKDGKVGVGHGGTKEIHAFQHLHDPSIAGSSGITGVQFVPGYRSRAVTVGEDGRLFLVDFEMRDTLGSWHIGAPATSLTIRPVLAKGKTAYEGDTSGCAIAIGTIHGKCYVYDGDGNKIGEQTVDTEGGKVLDVEWVSGDIHLLPGMGNNAHDSASSLSHAKSFPSVGSRQSAANLRHAVTAENLKPSKATGENAKLNPNSEIDFQWPEAKETASQGYMTLFSPVKKKQKRPEKAASLVGTRNAGTNQVSDPRLRTSEKEDQRSVISAPLLWNESTKKSAGQDRPKELKHDHTNESLSKPHDGTFLSPSEQKTPILGDLLPSLELSARSSDTSSDSSSFLTIHRVSSVASDVIKTNDRTSDGKLLSQIRSIRAKVEGDKAARGNLGIFAPYMSNKVKTSAMVRSGGATENQKPPSPPQEKIPDPRLQALDRARAEERVDGSGDETERRPRNEAPEEVELPSKEELVESDTSFDGDIWLVEEKPSKGRKRKNSPPEDDFEPSSSINSGIGEKPPSRTNSRAGSSKSRKTVSWDDRLDSHNDVDHSNFLAHRREPPPSPQFNVSSERSWPSIGATGTRTENSFIPDATLFRGDNSQKLSNTNIRHIPGASSSGENSFHTPNEFVFKGTGGMTGLEPALRNALLEMQMMFKAEMRSMQAEMARKFQVQRNVLEDLKSEMQMVREENGKLRNQLLEVSGVRAKRHQ